MAVMVVLAVCAFAQSAAAACSGSSPTRTAASAARGDVNDCVSVAASGDTIWVPAGSATWTSIITLPSTKDLTIIGNGGTSAMSCSGTEGSSAYACSYTGGTVITCNSGCFLVDMGATQRVSNFSMTGNGTVEIIECEGNANATDHFRIDHNRMISTGGWFPQRCKGGNGGYHPTGIWDHNRLENGIAIHTNGTLHQLDGGDLTQHELWAQDTPLGNSQNVVYVEANYFVTTVPIPNFTDGNYGGRVVIRFNRTQGPAIDAFEYHSPQGDNRGFQRWETYNNAVVDLDLADTCFFGMASIRGGTGVWFHNALSGSVSGCNRSLSLDNVRSDWSAPIDGVGPCDGSSPWDQNTGGQQGWHCRDQIGVAKDNSQWSHATTPTWNQELKPAYIWGNTRDGGNAPASVDEDGRNPIHIVANRDFYDYSTGTGSPQTVGVRVGTKANMPAGCTAGVAYWVTDEGTWNRLTPGADGQLYKCTAANTWTLYYTPYSYPHTWLEVPTAPTNLRIVVTTGGLLLVLPVFAVCVARSRRLGVIDGRSGGARGPSLVRTRS